MVFVGAACHAPPAVPDDAALRALAERLAPAAARDDRDGTFCFENLEHVRALRLPALTVPRAFGGAGTGLADSYRVVRGVGAGCPAAALILAMQLSKVAAAARSTRWPPALRETVLRDAAAHGALLNALRVERALGSPTRGGTPETVARRTATGWSLSGRKIYSTGAPALSWMEVFARTEDDPPRTGTFLVRAGTPGVRLEETWDTLGLRSSGSHDVVFDAAPVPAEHAIDLHPAGSAERDPNAAAWNALLVSAVYLGVARAARDWIVGFVRNRSPTSLGAPLASLPRVQAAVGRIEGLLATSDRIAGSAAAAADRGDPPSPVESGLLKVTLCDSAVEAVRVAVSLAGNHAQSRRNPLERHWRDVSCATVHVPTPDAAHEAAGRAALTAAEPR